MRTRNSRVFALNRLTALVIAGSRRVSPVQLLLVVSLKFKEPLCVCKWLWLSCNSRNAVEKLCGNSCLPKLYGHLECVVETGKKATAEATRGCTGCPSKLSSGRLLMLKAVEALTLTSLLITSSACCSAQINCFISKVTHPLTWTRSSPFHTTCDSKLTVWISYPAFLHLDKLHTVNAFGFDLQSFFSLFLRALSLSLSPHLSSSSCPAQTVFCIPLPTLSICSATREAEIN